MDHIAVAQTAVYGGGFIVTAEDDGDGSASTAATTTIQHTFPEFWNKGIDMVLKRMPHGRVTQQDFYTSNIQIYTHDLGSGVYGVVYPCTISGNKYAIKFPIQAAQSMKQTLPGESWISLSNYLANIKDSVNLTTYKNDLIQECSNAEKILEPEFHRLIRLHRRTSHKEHSLSHTVTWHAEGIHLEAVGTKLPPLSGEEHSWLVAAKRRFNDHPGYAHIHQIYHFDPTIPCIISQRADGNLRSIQTTIIAEYRPPHDTNLDPIAKDGSSLLFLSPLCSRIALQVGEALLYMYEESSIMLFDIKPGNILYYYIKSSSRAGEGGGGGHQNEMQKKIHCMMSDFGICSGNKDNPMPGYDLKHQGARYYNPINGYSLGWEENIEYMPFELAIFQYIATIADLIYFPPLNATKGNPCFNFCHTKTNLAQWPSVEKVVRERLQSFLADDAVSMANVSVSVAELLQFFRTDRRQLVSRFRKFMERVRTSVAYDEATEASKRKAAFEAKCSAAKKSKCVSPKKKDTEPEISEYSDSEEESIDMDKKRRLQNPTWQEIHWDETRQNSLNTPVNRHFLYQYVNNLIFNLKPAVDMSLLDVIKKYKGSIHFYKTLNIKTIFKTSKRIIDQLCRSIDNEISEEPHTKIFQKKQALEKLKKDLLDFLEWLQMLEYAKANLSNLNAVLYLLGCKLPYFFWDSVLKTVCNVEEADTFLQLASEAIHHVMLQKAAEMQETFKANLSRDIITSHLAQFNALFKILELKYDGENYLAGKNSVSFFDSETQRLCFKRLLETEMETYISRHGP